MSTFYKPHYLFKVVSWTGPGQKKIIEDSHFNYLYIKVCDKNRTVDEQEYSFFLSLDQMYVIRNGLSITIGNSVREFTLTNYEKSDADETYDKLCGILNIPCL